MGEFVDRSTYTCPGDAPAAMPSAPSATDSMSAGPGSDVNTTSDACATCCGVSPQFRAGLQEGRGRLPPEVVHGHRVARRLQVPGHVPSHRSKPNESYVQAVLP